MLHLMTSEPEQQIGVGTQDAFQRLWTPHRMAYIQGENKPTGPGADDGCPFCSIPAKSDEDGLVIRRGEQVYAVLNLYPYNGGHLMVVPYRHVADYTDLTDPETAELGELTKQAMTALRTASGAHGFNIGMNQGTVAGAGIAAHLHQHIVPRWGGDTNFMPVVGHTKVLPQLLADTRKMLAEAWPTAPDAAAGDLPAGPHSYDGGNRGAAHRRKGTCRNVRPQRLARQRRPLDGRPIPRQTEDGCSGTAPTQTNRSAPADTAGGLRVVDVRLPRRRSWTAVLRNDERLPNCSVSTPFSSRTLIDAACTTRSTGVAARSASSAMKRCRHGWSAQACRRPNGSGSTRVPPSQFSSGGYQVSGARAASRTTSSVVDQRQLHLAGLPELDGLGDLFRRRLGLGGEQRSSPVPARAR